MYATCTFPFHVMNIARTSHKTLVGLAALTGLLVACSSEPELLPGEAEWLAQVEPAEQLIAEIGEAAPTAEQCKQVKQYFDDGVVAFKVLMPQLEGFSLRKRDQRLGAIREYYEGKC